jgi:hypothetical protein
MKRSPTQLYSYKELSPEAQAKVIENKIKDAQNDDYLLQFDSDNMMTSLKAVCEACCLRLSDWSFGTYCRNWKVKVSNYDVEDLSGPRALAWFLRILINNGYPRPKRFTDMEFTGICGFTGVCYDEDVVETVWKELLDGETVANAFDQVAYTFCKGLEAQYEYLTSEEYVKEYLDEDEEIYTEYGRTY